MSKVITLSVVVALLIGSTAFGQLGLVTQVQDSSIGLSNGITLLHGHQNAGSTQQLALNLGQDTAEVCPTWANQSLVGVIGQVASACGECAIIEVAQGLIGSSVQMQEIGSCVQPKAQLQSINLIADQGVARQDGPGGGNAVGTIVLTGAQSGGNASGTMTERADIMGIQNSNINGLAASTGVVNSTMSVCTTQSQASL